MRSSNLVFLVMISVVCWASSASAVIINVGSGESIQAAINQAVNGDEIVVAPGTYVEHLLINNKSIILRSAAGETTTFIAPTGANSSLLKLEGDISTATIVGFTFAKAGGPNSANVIQFVGGNILTATISNCIFQGNMTSSLIVQSSDVLVANCKFINNTTGLFNSGEGNGAAVLVRNMGSVTILNSTFINNTAVGLLTSGLGLGAGVYLDGNGAANSATIDNCLFMGNTADNFGGGIYVGSGAVCSMNNCVLSENQATLAGGAVYNRFTNSTISNCTIVGNTAGLGGAMFNDNFSFPTVSNCILRDNTPNQIFDASSLATVLFSNIQGGWNGFGSHDNIDADPMFIDSLNGDFRLLSGSPCIDSGHNAFVTSDNLDIDNDGCTLERNPLDLGGSPRFADDPTTLSTGCGVPAIVDMGAYEFQGKPFPQMLIGDTNGNGLVNIDDLVDVLNAFGFTGACSNADLNGNGIVNIDDLVDVLNSFGGCP